MDASELISEIRDVEVLIAEAGNSLIDGIPGIPDEDLGKLATVHQGLLSQLAAIPEEFEKLKIWVLEVRGEVNSLPNLEEWSPSEFEVQDIDNVSSLARNIRVFLSENNFPITDGGFNNDIWHIGVWCTNTEAKEVYELVSTKFSKAIKSELITVHKVFWDFRLPKQEEE